MMETKGLYLLALVFVIAIGSFYYFSGKAEHNQTASASNYASEADQIQVIQTNETGQLKMTASIQRATQSMQTGTAELHGIRGVMYQQGEKDLIFAAERSKADQEFQHIELFDKITLSRLSGQTTPSTTFYTDYLQADTKTQQIETNSPVQIQSVQANLTSQGLKADLSTGEYALFNIRGQYAPTQP